MREEPPVSDLITDELQSIRNSVPGVRGSVTATSDGLLLAQDLPGLEPTQVAALVATMHAVAARASLSTQCGQVREVITRGADGYLAVYAAGSVAIVGVLGLSDMNIAMLNLQARKMIDRIGEHSASLVRPSPIVPPVPAPPPPPPAPAPTQPPGYPVPDGYNAGGYPDGSYGKARYGGYQDTPALPTRRPTGEWPRYNG
jgi:predicted regulator of Ras-like GTPase activity (Roadblock/LC7/MglB family)